MWLLCVGSAGMSWGFVACPDVGGEDKGNGVSLGCSNWDSLTGIIPVGGIAGVVAPGLVLWDYGGGVGMWAGYWVAWGGGGPWLMLIGMV